MGLLLLLLACRSPTADPGFTVEQVSSYVRAGTDEPETWARAVRSALVLAEQPVDEDHVCQVLAIVEQESGYEADPVVPGLAGIVEKELEQALKDKLGVLAGWTGGAVLDVAPVGEERTFRDRLRTVRTERDLDELFQAIVAHHEGRAPAVGTVVRAVAPRLTERLNPISTAGSMQVKVDWAQAHPVSRGMDPKAVRASMYSVEGGVRYGTLRLFATADYADPIHRFADFNAGPYASRNAALQEQLAVLEGTELTLDGDLLRYNGRGRPQRSQDGETYRAAVAFAATRGVDAGQVHRDLTLEKGPGLETTATWAMAKAAYRETAGELSFARVPVVQLDSPKLRGSWTTASFAERVQRRYDQCLARS